MRKLTVFYIKQRRKEGNMPLKKSQNKEALENTVARKKLSDVTCSEFIWLLSKPYSDAYKEKHEKAKKK